MSETAADAPAQEPTAPAEEVTKSAEEQPAKADETDWKAEARKWEARAKENKTEAEGLKTASQSQLDAIAKALGLKSDDTPPDPAKLTEQLSAEQANAREARVQLAVYRNARDHEADADALLDSASFLRTLKDIDPTDQDAVSAAIKAAVESNPRYRATAPSTVPPSFGGGPRPSADKPDPGPGVARLRDAYSSSTK